MRFSGLARHALGLGAIVAVLSGCALRQKVAGPSALPAMRGVEAALRGDAKDPWLYVTGNSNDVVAIYDLERTGFPEIGTITEGVRSPGGVFVDSKGKVYVANETGTVAIYKPGQRTPHLILSADLDSPQSVAVDAKGYVYVCNRGKSPDIVVFPPDDSFPSKRITSDLITSPRQIQFDPMGDLYYTDGNTGVSEIRAGSRELEPLHLRELQRTDGLAIDPMTGDLFVGTYGYNLDGVRVYSAHSQQPIRTLHDAKGSDLYSQGVMRRSEYIFIPDSYNNTVKAFLSNSTEPSFVIHTSLVRAAVGVAVKRAGVP